MSITLPTRRLVSQDDAAIIENPTVPRSRFTGTWTRKTAFDAGFLVPFLVDEAMPGDHLSYDVTAYLRLSTPLFPMFDNQRVDTFFFFVPNRIIWTNWVRMMGQQANPGDSIDFAVPQVGQVGGAAVNSIYDHMGIPFLVGLIDPTSDWSVNVLPLRAYNKIWNSWFRDQNLQNSAGEATGDGPDTFSAYSLRRRAKSHDYFTSALPWPQKFTAPNVPVAGIAPVTGIGVIQGGGAAVPVDVYQTSNAPGIPSTFNRWKAAWMDTSTSSGGVYVHMTTGDNPQIYADLSSATGVAINTFRQAFMIQSLLERDARGGTRYVELIRAHFGVTNPDFRLQRPEYIGGGSTPLTITPIAQTAPSTGVPVGALGAAGTAAGSHRASYAATEHGYILGLINVRSELSYQQGLNRLWSRRTRYDFYWPALAQLGEQAILRKEIYAKGTVPSPDNDNFIFGYQERWHEYRTHVSEVTGIMRSGVTGTLDAWHLAQNFATAPTLSDTFIQDTPPMTRILAGGSLTTNQQYLADIQISRTAVRPIPTFGTPANLGRF